MKKENEKLVIENLNLARKAAWDWYKHSGADLDEMLSEAYLALCESVETYDKTKGTKLSTWATVCIKYKLQTFLSKQQKENNNVSLQEENYDIEYIEMNPFFELVDEMSPACKEISQIILSEPQEYAGKPKLARGRLYKKLRNLGWSWGGIWKSFKEMKNTLNEKPVLDTI